MLYSSSLENYCRLENYENEVHVTSFERNISIMDNRLYIEPVGSIYYVRSFGLNLLNILFELSILGQS